MQRFQENYNAAGQGLDKHDVEEMLKEDNHFILHASFRLVLLQKVRRILDFDPREISDELAQSVNQVIQMAGQLNLFANDIDGLGDGLPSQILH